MALQDSIICFELLAAAIAHWFAFTYKDYLPRSGPVVRLKLLYAFRDAIGVKDILLDSVETYTGSQYNYRTFEPAGVSSVTEVGRKNRLRAGLRYSSGGQTKYWIDDSSRPSSSTRLIQDDALTYDTFPAECSFESVIHDAEAEELYQSSRNFAFGDYNIPTIEEYPAYIPRPPSTPWRYATAPPRQTRPPPQAASDAPPPEPSTVPKNPRPISPPVMCRADSINVSPWGTNSLRTNLNWEEELRRAANREFVQTSTQSDIDPWRK